MNVRVRWTALCALLSSAGALATAAPSGATTYAANCGVAGYLAFKPDYWSAGCTGGSPTTRPIHWQTWNSRVAIGRGTAQLREPCGDQPCYKAGMYKARGTVRLSRPRSCVTDDGVTLRYFSRARWSIRYRAHNPFGKKPGWSSMTFTVPSESGCAMSID